MIKYYDKHENFGNTMRSAFALRLKNTIDELYEMTKGVDDIDREQYLELMLLIGKTGYEALEFEELMEDK